MTSIEAADRLGLTRRTFLRRVEAGRIPYVTKLHEPNGAYLFDPAVIDRAAREAEAS